jgi:hypothetical protein
MGLDMVGSPIDELLVESSRCGMERCIYYVSHTSDSDIVNVAVR